MQTTLEITHKNFPMSRSPFCSQIMQLLGFQKPVQLLKVQECKGHTVSQGKWHRGQGTHTEPHSHAHIHIEREVYLYMWLWYSTVL